MLSGNAVIDGRNLLDPAPPVRVLEREHRIRRPVKVVRDEGYLPVDLVQGIADYPPAACASAVKLCWHDGHLIDGASSRRLMAL